MIALPILVARDKVDCRTEVVAPIIDDCSVACACEVLAILVVAAEWVDTALVEPAVAVDAESVPKIIDSVVAAVVDVLSAVKDVVRADESVTALLVLSAVVDTAATPLVVAAIADVVAAMADVVAATPLVVAAIADVDTASEDVESEVVGSEVVTAAAVANEVVAETAVVDILVADVETTTAVVDAEAAVVDILLILLYDDDDVLLDAEVVVEVGVLLKQEPGEHIQLLPHPEHSNAYVHDWPVLVHIPNPIIQLPDLQSWQWTQGSAPVGVEIQNPVVLQIPPPHEADDVHLFPLLVPP